MSTENAIFSPIRICEMETVFKANDNGLSAASLPEINLKLTKLN